MLADDQILEILSLYQAGWRESEIAIELDLPWWCVRDVIDQDDWNFPEEPLRERVLH